jgi:hypothetical protein
MVIRVAEDQLAVSAVLYDMVRLMWNYETGEPGHSVERKLGLIY